MHASLVSTVWLELLRAQQPVRYAAIAKAFPELEYRQCAKTLHMAFRLGYVERDGKPRDYTYSVTPRCTVPPGVPIVEILEATT